MYRDRAHQVDEHDRAVGAILIGEALTAQCEHAAIRFRDVLAPDRWTTLRDAQDAYPEIWRQLDRACKVLAARGASTAEYEELRPHVRTALVAATEDGEHGVDPTALEDARRAVAELKLAVPGADWNAIDLRTQRLLDGRQFQRRHWLPTSAVIVGMLLLGVSWAVAALPEPMDRRPDPMVRELAEVVQDRQQKLAQLEVATGAECNSVLAEEYMKLLVFDGRRGEARSFADGYMGRCGEDSNIEDWANAPRPRAR